MTEGFGPKVDGLIILNLGSSIFKKIKKYSSYYG